MTVIGQLVALVLVGTLLFGLVSGNREFGMGWLADILLLPLRMMPPIVWAMAAAFVAGAIVVLTYNR